jgi:hypothetical protein
MDAVDTGEGKSHEELIHRRDNPLFGEIKKKWIR